MKELADSHWSQCDFVVIDVEGNGQSPQEIIELAIISLRQARIVGAPREWLIRPLKPVSERASNLHGILNRDIETKPRFAEISSEVSHVLGQHAVIGHNVAVDVRLLKEKLPWWNPIVAIDTMRLARWANPSAGSYALSSLIEHYGLASRLNGRPHRAASDALAAAELFLELVRQLDKRSKLSLRTLAEISASADDPFFANTQGNLF